MASAGQGTLKNSVVPNSPENVTIPEKEKSTEQVLTGNVSDDNTVVISQSAESFKTVSEHLEESMSVEKNKDAEENVIDVDNLNSGESPA
ncbi:hypothetical protein A2U01_0080525, partial [Trifolium medium]|nr:hypothetical protein [Trifolium medium]